MSNRAEPAVKRASDLWSAPSAAIFTHSEVRGGGERMGTGWRDERWRDERGAKSPGEGDKTRGRRGKRRFKKPVNSINSYGRAAHVCVGWTVEAAGQEAKRDRGHLQHASHPFAPRLPWQHIAALLFQMSNNAHETKERPDNRPLRAAFLMN